MIRNRALAACLLLTVSLAAGLPAEAESPDPCKDLGDAWAALFNPLVEQSRIYSQVKEEPVTSRIRRRLKEQPPHMSIAQAVYSVLADREERLKAMKREIEDLVSQERQAFRAWKRCMSRTRRNDPPTADKEALLTSRADLQKGLDDLLLDEAFVQYKDYHAPAQATHLRGHRRSSGFWNTGSGRSHWNRRRPTTPSLGYYQ